MSCVQDRAGPDQGQGPHLPARRGLHLPPTVRDTEARGPQVRPGPADHPPQSAAQVGDQQGQEGVLGSVHLPGDREQTTFQDGARRRPPHRARSVVCLSVIWKLAGYYPLERVHQISSALTPVSREAAV